MNITRIETLNDTIDVDMIKHIAAICVERREDNCWKVRVVEDGVMWEGRFYRICHNDSTHLYLARSGETIAMVEIAEKNAF